MGTVRELRDFLIEAELDHYYSAFRNELKIATIPQLKYVDEEDLVNIGMTKPEMRRLKKYYKKECPQGKLEKFKRVSTQYISKNGEKKICQQINFMQINRFTFICRFLAGYTWKFSKFRS